MYLNDLDAPCQSRKFGLDSVLPGPLSSRRFVAGSIGLVDVCDFWNKGVVGVGVCKHRADTQEHYGG